MTHADQHEALLAAIRRALSSEDPAPILAAALRVDEETDRARGEALQRWIRLRRAAREVLCSRAEADEAVALAREWDL